MRYFSIFVLFIVATSARPVQAQLLTTGFDPLGRPYYPLVGVVQPEIKSGIDAKSGELLGIAFSNGLKGNAHTPYGAVTKNNLEEASRKAAAGAGKARLRKDAYWESVGVHYLARLEINSLHYEQYADSVFDHRGKFDRIERYTVATANLTARLTDVATSKILMYNNFDASATTRGYDQYKNQSDSMRVFNLLCRSVSSTAGTLLNSLVPGAPAILGIDRENDGKAESVLLANAAMLSLSKMGERFLVYAITNTYTIDGQPFRHVELVGEIEKDKSFNFQRCNFTVRNGEKKIAEHVKVGTQLVCTRRQFPIGPYLPSGARTSLAIDDFKNSSRAPVQAVRILQDGFIETIARRPLLIDAVDRELYQAIQQEQTIQSKTRSDATQAGIAIGSEYLLTAELLELNSQREVRYEMVPVAPAKTETTATKAAPTTPVVGTSRNRPAAANANDPAGKSRGGSTTGAVPAVQPKPAAQQPATPTKPQVEKKRVPTEIQFTSNGRINVSIISVKTSEVVFTNTYDLRGVAKEDYTKDAIVLARGQEKAFRNMAEQFATGVWARIQPIVTPKIQLVALPDVEKDKAETVLLAAGQLAGLFEDQRLNVYEIVDEDIDGQILQRDVLIGQLRVKDVLPETALCKVKEGEKDILKKFNNKARLYARLQ